MRIAAVAAIAVAMAASAQAGQKLDIFANGTDRVPFDTLHCAEYLASRMLASADVRIAWHGSEPGQPAKYPNRTIVIQLEMNRPASYRPGALACAMPYEGVHIAIFYNRILDMQPPSLAPRALAHVIVHEVTHILRGDCQHSPAGIMKAHWDEDDLFEMQHRLLPLLAEDIAKIRDSQNGDNRN